MCWCMVGSLMMCWNNIFKHLLGTFLCNLLFKLFLHSKMANIVFFYFGPTITQLDRQLPKRTDDNRTDKICQGCFSSCHLPVRSDFC